MQGPRRGVSKSTFYRWWRDMQDRAAGSTEMKEVRLLHGIKRADLERVLEEERLAEEARARAARIAYPGPSLEERLATGASRFKAWREVHGLTIGELAAATGIPAKHLDQIENATRTPNAEQIVSISTALGVEVAELVPR